MSGQASCWLPLGVHLGLPLTNVPTCEAACAAIASRRLFAAASVEEHTHALDAMRTRVDNCVDIARRGVATGVGDDGGDECDDGWLDAADETEVLGEVAHPSRPLLFDGSQLCQMREVADLY